MSLTENDKVFIEELVEGVKGHSTRRIEEAVKTTIASELPKHLDRRDRNTSVTITGHDITKPEGVRVIQKVWNHATSRAEVSHVAKDQAIRSTVGKAVPYIAFLIILALWELFKSKIGG